MVKNSDSRERHPLHAESSTGHLCQWQSLWDAPAAEGGGLWPLEICRDCGLVRLARLPSPEEAYPPEYYGNSAKKFLPGFEVLSHLPPALLPEAEAAAEKMAKAAGRRPKVLDVGCGRGYLLRRLQRAGWTCSGIDIQGSPTPLHDSSLDCCLGDACSLPWPDETFDLVVINHVLEHVANPALACREAARVLGPGGVLYVGVPNFGSWQSRFFRRNWFPLEVPRHLFHFTPSTLAAVVSEAGFSVGRFTSWSLTQGAFGFIQSALNALDTANRNAFLSLVKGHRTASKLRLLLHAAGACALAPLGIFETIVTSMAGRGPVIALIAFKSSPRSTPFHPYQSS